MGLGGSKHATNLEEALACFKRALRIYTLGAFPKEYARTQFRMGTIYSDQVWEEQQANLEEAIACYMCALQVYTLHTFPLEYANTQNNLGNAYRELLKGLPQTNLEEAIACYMCALQVYTLETNPIFYALAQRNLGLTYMKRLGEHWSNLEEAITCFKHALQVYTLETFPGFCADTQFKLGNLYQERQKGERWSNLEEAIACYRQALQIYSLENFPDEYAANQLNLGHTYWKRIRGERQANIEEAIACFRRALQVFTLETSPENYAGIQLNLGLAYNDRIAGEPRTNLEETIACLKRALQIFPDGEDPRNYALVQHAMGIAYRKRIEGERLSNLEEAITCFKRALQIFTLESFPTEHAMAQLNLGTVYSTKITHKHQFNPEGAMTCFQQALQVFTLESSPEYYAITQLDLGLAYRDRMEGKRSTNLEEAIACFQQALQVFTLESFPHEYHLVLQSLVSCEAELRQVGGGNAQIQQEAREVNSIADLLHAWLTIENDRDKRRFLEAHLDLLDLRAEMSIKSSIEAVQRIGILQETGSDGLSQVKAEIIRYLNGFLRLLSTIRTYGSNFDAIRRACIDVYGGLVLDVPAWLEDVERQVDLQYQMELPKNTAVGRAISLHQAITRARSEDLAPEVLAALKLHLHRALADIGDFPLLTKREAMKYAEEALEVFTHTRYPLQYAQAQSGLAEMYLALASEAALLLDVPPSFVLSSSEGSITIGDQLQSEPPPREPRHNSLKKAISCYLEALRVYTPDAFPLQYAIAQHNLGSVYLEGSTVAYRDDLEKAIACYVEALPLYKTHASSSYYAALLFQLGQVYQKRIAGERRNNLERAIASYQEALRTYTVDKFPEKYAKVQSALGSVYRSRIEGESRDNLERALQCYRKALRVYTPQGSLEYSRVQLNLVQIEAERGNWAEVHEALGGVLTAEETIMVDHWRLVAHRTAAARDGFALTKLSRISEAAAAIERGRSRSLLLAVADEASNPNLILDEKRRARFIAAKQELISTHQDVNTGLAIDLDPDSFPTDPTLQAKAINEKRHRLQLAHETAYSEARTNFNAIVTDTNLQSVV